MHCPFSSHFTFITKEKLHFSSTCSFCCCLLNKGSAVKVALQFVIRELVVNKLVAYKKRVHSLIFIILHHFIVSLFKTFFCFITKFYRQWTSLSEESLQKTVGCLRRQLSINLLESQSKRISIK